jgi:hypothetical protein
MGRSLEVRGKSENLPVIGCTLVGEPVSPGTYNNVSKSLICFGAGLRNGGPDVLARWNASAGLGPDAIG